MPIKFMHVNFDSLLLKLSVQNLDKWH